MMVKSIQGLIDEALSLEQSQPRQRSGKYSPSSLGRCYRLQYWNRLNESPTNPPDARSLRVFRAGDLFHDYVKSFIKDAQFEVKVEDEHFCGYADVVNGDVVYDIKSQHSKGFWHMKSKGYDINKEKTGNILQVVFYAYKLGKKEGRLVFVSKDDLCIEEYGFYVEKWNEVLSQEISRLIEFWNNKELPPAIPRAYGGKDCTYCQFKDKCFALEKLEGRGVPDGQGSH